MVLTTKFIHYSFVQKWQIPMKNSTKKVVIWIATILLILLFGFIVFVILSIPTALTAARLAAQRMTCISHLKGICLAIQEYQSKNKEIPFFGDKTTGDEYWSWRAVIIAQNEKIQFRFSEPWNSEYNLPLFEGQIPNDPDELQSPRCMFCSGDEQREKSSYVAVKGPGTVWTEMQNGNLPGNLWDYPEMILIIETSEPKNFWAEPGDDITPEEVIRLFETDPGLVKNSKQSFRNWTSHWPKNYVTAGNEPKNFDTIKSVEELRKLLTVSQEQIEKVRKKLRKEKE